MRPLTARRPATAADPAPSRWSYRAQRLWLTPIFRTALRVGLPLGCIAALTTAYFADEANRQALLDGAHEIRREIEDRPEFRVNLLGIDGASPAATQDIRTALSLDLPVSSFDLDLEDLRARVESLPAIASADLRIQSGGYLAVRVEERVPVLIWQTRDGAVLIDADGHFVAGLNERALDGPLPAIAGDAAHLVVEEALALHAAAAPLGERLQGLVRMGERRWDVVLTDDRRILLPEIDAVNALDRVLAVHDVTDILNRDILRVDLRNPDRLSVQLTPEAVEEMRRLRALDAQTREQRG
jgi:cell division protein FtsQ